MTRQKFCQLKLLSIFHWTVCEKNFLISTHIFIDSYFLLVLSLKFVEIFVYSIRELASSPLFFIIYLFNKYGFYTFNIGIEKIRNKAETQI